MPRLISSSEGKESCNFVSLCGFLYVITCESLKYLDLLVLMIFKNDGEIIKIQGA